MPKPSAEGLRYNLTVPRLLITAVLFGSVMTWAQTPRAELQGAQLGVAAEHLQQGKAEQAIRECKSVLAADPRSAPAHMLLGLAYVGLGSTDRIADAKAELQQALDLDPELLWARFYLARVYFDQGLSEKAQEQLERGLKQSPGSPDFLSLLGEVRRELGDPGASVELNRKALEADAKMTPVHYFLALAYLDLKQEQAAIAEFEKAIHSPYVTPETYNALASLYIKKHLFAAAEDLCRKAIAMDRSRPDAYLSLGRIYNAQNASDKALEALRRALPEGKEFPATEYYRGLQADLAVERGVAYTAKKLYARAIEAYARALEFDAGRAVIHRRLAELYRQNGDPAGAALHTKEADQLEKGQR
jgi:tetratricopeptide (TPR) repeat protein